MLWTGTEGGQSEYLGLFTRKSNWYVMDSDELSSGGYVSSIKSSTYFVCNLEQIFAINPHSIRIEVGSDGAYGSPQLQNWSQIFDLKEIEKTPEIGSQAS